MGTTRRESVALSQASTAVEPTPAMTEKSKSKDEAYVREKEAMTDSEAGSVKTIEHHQLSWQQAAGLIFGEYIVIAILSFPSSYAVLGMAGGLIATVVIGLSTLWTSHWLWRYCLANPHLLNICDIGHQLFGGKRGVYELTLLGLVLNNVFIMGLHVLSGALALNTLSDHATCTIVWSGIFIIVMFVLSLSRELKKASAMAMFAAAMMLIALILCLAFAGAKGPREPTTITIRAFAAPGTTFVAGLNALLNIVYTFIGQILIPSFVQDMRKPEDFPKALFAVTFAEIVLFSIGGSVLYAYLGAEVTSPAYGSLQPTYAKVVAAFTIPTILVVGIIYAVITSRTIYYRIFGADSVHVLQVTPKGTIVWVSIVVAVWVGAFVIGEAIPFFNDLLALMSSLFDSFFGHIFWSVAFFRMYGRDAFRHGLWRKVEACFAVLIFCVGLFILGAGTYTSVSAIMDSYAAGTVAGAFSCANNGF